MENLERGCDKNWRIYFWCILRVGPVVSWPCAVILSLNNGSDAAIIFLRFRHSSSVTVARFYSGECNRAFDTSVFNDRKYLSNSITCADTWHGLTGQVFRERLTSSLVGSRRYSNSNYRSSPGEMWLKFFKFNLCIRVYVRACVHAYCPVRKKKCCIKIIIILLIFFSSCNYLLKDYRIFFKETFITGLK